ncbi:MAG: hypothetical protein KAW19_10360 [Candidatus Aminicenantes bacterium]|nr:hypothetical protein [Candidatus Aminicenantes bacterium]
MDNQTIAVIFCITLGTFGAVFAIIGTIKEVRGKNPSGLILIIIGTIAMGFAGIIISVAAKLLNSH